MAADRAVRFDFLAGRNTVSRQAKQVQHDVDGLGSKLASFGGFAVKALGGVALAAGGMAAAGTVMGVKTAAAMEQAQIGFTTLLGSASEAKAYMADLSKFAATTPFEFPGLVDASRLLLGVGVSSKKVIPMLRDFGDAAGALAIDQDAFNRIMLATSQAISAGKFQAGDLNQIMTNGLPVWTLLSKAMHKSVPELRDLASKGKLLAKDVLPALQAQMHKDYGGSMAAQSKTLSGLWSTFMDTLSMGLASAILPVQDQLKGGLVTATKIAGDALSKLPAIIDGISSAFNSIPWGDIKANFKSGWSKITGAFKKFDTSPIGKKLKADAVQWAAGMVGGIKTGLATGDWSGVSISIGQALSAVLSTAVKAGGWLGKAAADLMVMVSKWMQSVNWLEVGKKAAYAAVPFTIGFVNGLLGAFLTTAKEHPLDMALFITSLIPIGRASGVLKPLIAKIPILRSFLGPILGALEKAGKLIEWPFKKFFGLFSKHFAAGFRGAFPAAERSVAGWFRGVAESIALRGMYAWDAIKRWTAAIPNLFGSVAGKVASAVDGFIGRILSPFGRIGSRVYEAGQELIRGFIRGIKSIPGAAKVLGFLGLADLATIPATKAGGGGSTGGSGGGGGARPPTRLARGGIATRPTFAQIGEGGEPEAVVPLSKARAMGFGGGGDTYNINVSVAPGGEAEAGRQIVRAIQEYERRSGARWRAAPA